MPWCLVAALVRRTLFVGHVCTRARLLLPMVCTAVPCAAASGYLVRLTKRAIFLKFSRSVVEVYFWIRVTKILVLNPYFSPIP